MIICGCGHVTKCINSDAFVLGNYCYQAIALTTWSGWVRILGGSRQSPDNPLQLNAGFAILRTADLGCWRDQGLRSLRRQSVQPSWRHPHYVKRHNAIMQCSWGREQSRKGAFTYA